MINQPIRLLLVEDNPTDVLLLEEAIAEVGTASIEITHVGRLSLTLEKIERERFDIVLCDLGLPDSQGLDTFRDLHDLHPEVPILVLTGLNDEETGIRAIKEGAQDYLIKGQMNGHALTRVIRYSIERKQSEIALHESQRFLQSTLDALSSHIAVIEENGTVIAVNHAWQHFAEENDGSPIACGAGSNYLAACDQAKGDWKEGAVAAAHGIRKVIAGEQAVFRLEYPCHSPTEQRWFNLRVTRFNAEMPVRVVVAHENITERKQAESSLLESQQRLALATESAHIGIWDWDVVSNKMVWDAQMMAFYGVQEENFTGAYDAWQNGIHPEDREQAEADITAALDGSRDFQSQFRVLWPNGEVRYIEAHAIVQRAGDGSPLRMIGINRDITERKQAEQELQESNEKFQMLVNNITDTFWIRSPDMREQHYLSPAYERMWGRPANNQYADPQIWSDFIVPEDRERVIKDFSLLMGDAPRISSEYRIMRPDGEVRWHQTRGFQVRNDAGELTSLTGIVSDITERKQTEDRIRVSEANLVRAQKMAHLGNWSWTLQELENFQANPLSWSDEVFHIFGYQPDSIEASYELFINGIHPDDRTNVEAMLHSAIQTGHNYNIEHRVVRSDGTERIVQQRSDLIYDENGRPIKMVGTVQDITERKQSEDALRASEERFQSIVANVPGMVYQFVIQPDGTIEWPFVSEGCRELFNLELEVFHTNPTLPLETIHPDDLPHFERSIAISAQNLTPWSWEGRRQLPEGGIQWMQATSRPQRLPGGGTLWNGLVMDITARKEAETERDRFFTLTLDLLGIADSSGYFKRINPAFEAMLGFSNEELMAVPFLEFVHPDDRAATLQEMDKITTGESIVQFENRYRCRDDSYKWLQWISTPFEELWYFAARDITQIKEAEATLRKANDELELRVSQRTAELNLANATLYKNHEFLEAVLENTAEGIVACDAEGHLTFFNRATREFHGLPLEPLPAEQWSEYYSLYFPDGITPMRKEDVPLFRALSGSHVRDMELVIAARDGSTRLVLNNGEPLFDASGEKLGAVVVMHDITERKQTEVELQQAKEEADSANLAKSEFLSRMSHELRTPLNAILGFGQILERQELSSLSKESVGHILRGGRHLLSLINEVLDIARVESGRMDVSLAPVSLASLVSSVCALMRPLAQERNLHLIEVKPDFCHCHVMADEQRLRQVLINLLSNAIKYNREGGEVEISCEPKMGNSVSIAVRDSGPGIAPEDLPKLFVPFERLDADDLRIEGTGLGLPLSQRLMEAMGGALRVESIVGSGTTLTIELPQTPPPAGTAETQQDSAQEYSHPASEHTYSVLSIEDNAANLQLMETIFASRPDIALISTIQGSIGLELALQYEPDLILLALNLPDMHGSEVLKRLQRSAITRDIPVIIVTADASTQQKERLLFAGAKAYLTKPIDVSDLLQTLDKLLEENS